MSVSRRPWFSRRRESDALGDEKDVDRAPVELVDERQTRQAMRARVDAGIADDGPTAMLDDAARATDLLASAEHRDRDGKRILG
jgi:hypothetical protein